MVKIKATNYLANNEQKNTKKNSGKINEKLLKNMETT